jgi:hypothetical protein
MGDNDGYENACLPMPELSGFYGIVIQMYFGDHPPPHFHATYGGSRAVVDIETLALIEGHLPPRARSGNYSMYVSLQDCPFLY